VQHVSPDPLPERHDLLRKAAPAAGTRAPLRQPRSFRRPGPGGAGIAAVHPAREGLRGAGAGMEALSPERVSLPGVVVVGASLGGLAALGILLHGLARQFPMPVVVAQHRGREGPHLLLTTLRRRSNLPVVEPNDKEPLRAGRTYLAPADYHLLVEEG